MSVNLTVRRPRNSQRRLGLLRNCYPSNVVLQNYATPVRFPCNTTIPPESLRPFSQDDQKQSANQEKMEKLRRIRNENAKNQKLYGNVTSYPVEDAVLNNCSAANLIHAAENARCCSTAPPLGNMLPIRLGVQKVFNSRKDHAKQVNLRPTREAWTGYKSCLEKKDWERDYSLASEYLNESKSLQQAPFALDQRRPFRTDQKLTRLPSRAGTIHTAEAVIRLVQHNGGKLNRTSSHTGGDITSEKVRDYKRSMSAQCSTTNYITVDRDISSSHQLRFAADGPKQPSNLLPIRQNEAVGTNVRPKSRSMIVWPRKPLTNSRIYKDCKSVVLFDQEPLGIVGANCRLSFPQSPRPASKLSRALVDTKYYTKIIPPHGRATAPKTNKPDNSKMPGVPEATITQQCKCKLDSRIVRFSCYENKIHEFESDQPVIGNFN